MLLAVALLARLPGLGRSLWYDELFTLRHFADSPAHALLEQKHANNHPLASLLAFLARQASEDPRVLRLPFVILASLGVAATARLGRTRGAALAAALLAVFHPSAVAYAQEVRGYAPLLLLAPLVTLLALEGRRPWLLALAVALGLLAHATLGALVVALALLALRERARATLAGLAAGAALGLSIGAPTLPVRFVAHGPSGPDGLADVAVLLGTNDGRLLHPALAAPLLLLALLGATRARRLALVTGVTALLLALPILLRAPFYARFALVLLPLIIGLAGEGAGRLLEGRRALLAAAPLALLLAIATARRAHWETEPIGPALASVPGGRFEFTGLGAELMTNDPEPTHRVELATREPTPFQGLYANVRIVPRN
ncbi:MAG TPA: hypothetical protein VFF73_23805 [Planctomycetota bacterium]|nr:hypothetical protein [Planctomycetota bacterium]